MCRHGNARPAPDAPPIGARRLRRCHSGDVAQHSPVEPPIDVVDTGITIDHDGVAFPTVVIDVTGRPDVADLPRVHALEGIGDIRTLVDVRGDELLMTVLLTTPVVARFTVRFSLEAHVQLLAHAAIAGHLLLATSDPTAEQPLWLAIDLDRRRLAEVLVPFLGGDAA